MRSSEAVPGDAWPHDMQITVDDRPHALLELLWVREAHDLQLAGDDLPPLLVDTPRRASALTESAEARAEWQRAWPRIWRASVEHAGRESDPGLFTKLQVTADGSSERARLLRLLEGPSWRDEIGGEAVNDDSYREWTRRGSDAHSASFQAGLRNSPEHRDLAALIPAWRAGLTKIVTIPCRGEFARVIGTTSMLVTAATRHSSDAYRRALAHFA